MLKYINHFCSAKIILFDRSKLVFSLYILIESLIGRKIIESQMKFLPFRIISVETS